MLAFILLIALAKSRKSNSVEDHIPPGSPMEFDTNSEVETLEMMKEWENVMKDFVPEDMVTFVIPARTEQEFYETVEITPAKLRGAWFLASDFSKDIDFAIIDPNQQVIFERKGRRETIFAVDAKIAGIYVFRFKNNKIVKENFITYTFSRGNSTESILKAEHLTPVESKLNDISKRIKDFQVDNQFAQLRQESHYKTVASANQNVFWFSLLESFGVIAVTVWQIYYIKKLLDNRRVL